MDLSARASVAACRRQRLPALNALLPLDQLALGLVSAALRLRALLGNSAQIELGNRGLSIEHGGQQPVYNQVRIAPDRRREVRVSLGGQREVSGVVHAVARLLQRA